MNASPGHVAVVGAGVFGAAAAVELRRRGWRVTLVDLGPLPRPEAASTDVSKLVRMEYGADAFYHALAESALEGWDRWNAEWPRALYHEDGVLILSAASLERAGFEGDSWRLLRDRGHRPERTSPARLAQRFPAWRPEAFSDGFFNPRGGWVESAEVVARLVEIARGSGVEVLPGTATGVRASVSRVAGVTLADGAALSADRVVVAAGAWTPALLPWLSGLMWPTAQPVLHFHVDDPAAFGPPRFPPWAADIARTGWYGFPALSDGRVKIGHHGPGARVAPDARPDVSPEHEARCRAFLREALPSLADAPLAGTRTCMYCDTFDGDFLIAEDPEREGLVVAAGGSGHGFKFAPLLGTLVADALEGRATERFAWRDSAGLRTEEARFDG